MCAAFGLGDPAGAMTPVAGGLTHRLWRLETSRGTFAVKVLDRTWGPPDLEAWYERAFTLERAAFAAGIAMPRPVPAAATGGCLAQVNRADGQKATVRAHAWVEGESLRNDAVYPADDVARVGGIVARIHALGMAAGVTAREALRIEGEAYWRTLALRAEAQRAPWTDDLRAYLPVIAEAEAYIAAAHADRLPLLLGHRDADKKNFVRAPDGALLLVDWDAAGPVHPRHDLANTALTWAGAHLGEPDPALLRAFFDGYRAAGGAPHVFAASDLAEMLATNLRWVDFIARRALAVPDARGRAPAHAAVAGALRRGKLRRFLASAGRWARLVEEARGAAYSSSSTM